MMSILADLEGVQVRADFALWIALDHELEAASLVNH